MHKYARQTRILVAVDCILFGFDGQDMKILLIKRGLEPEKGKWSLMGGFIQPNESLDDASKRVLYALTGLSDVYMEQLYTFGNPLRDPIERTLSVGYFALLDLTKFNPTLTAEYHAEWFSIHKFPSLIFDHNEIVAMARQRLRQKAATSPVIFELLPERFTIPQILLLFESIFETQFDKRNFSRKLMATGLVTKTRDKDKTTSKKGAYLYKLNKKNYQANLTKLLSIIPKGTAYLATH